MMVKDKENTVLTIDVGGASLKMAEFSVNPAGDTLTLERYAIKEFSEELTDTNFADAFAEAFQQLMAENGFVSRSVRVSISSLHAFQRLSKLPPLLGNRLRVSQVVEGEAKLTVPYPLEEVIWDYQLIKHTKVFEVQDEPGEDGEVPEPRTESVEELEAFFVAIKDELVTAICTVLLDADLDVLSVEVSPTSLYNAARANMYGEGSCDMILDMGGRGSNLIIIDEGRIFVRAIPIGGNTISQQIAKEFSIGFADAEEMKRKHCFVALGGAYEDSDSEVAATISKIARNVMTRLHGEINRSINAWRSMYEGNRPSSLHIVGGSSIIPYVPHFLNEKLGLEINFLNTFPVINIGDTVEKSELQEVAHLFPSLIGLGIRHIRTCPVEINLLPKIVRSAKELQQKKPYFYGSIACALLCLLVFYAGVSARTGYDRKLESLARQELDKKNEISEQIKRLGRDLNDARGSYDELRGITNARYSWMQLITELQNITPNNMWFTQIDGVKEYNTTDPNAAPAANPNANPDGAPGMPGMDPGMDPAMMDGMETGPTEAPNEVAWLRLKGHSLVMNLEAARSVEDQFRENVLKSPLFDNGQDSYKNPVLTVHTDNNNLTSFIIYVKLKTPIKQQ